MGGQGFPFHLTDEVGVRKAALQLGRLRPVADNDLRAGQIERQKCRQILSTAKRPTLTKIGRGRSIAAARSGRKR
jgi:hypothetical protein